MESIAKAYEVTSSRGAPTEQTSKQPIECLKKNINIKTHHKYWISLKRKEKKIE